MIGTAAAGTYPRASWTACNTGRSAPGLFFKRSTIADTTSCAFESKTSINISSLLLLLRFCLAGPRASRVLLQPDRTRSFKGSLLVTQSRQRIEAGGTTRGPETRGNSDCRHQPRDRYESYCITGASLNQHTLEKLAHTERTGQTNQQAERDQDKDASKKEPDDVRGLSAKRHPKADLLCPLNHGVRGDGIEPDGSQSECDGSED